MKRFHVHVAVRDLEQSKRFYSAIFGFEPTVVKPDYAKWMLDDPRVNFAISQRGNSSLGVNHLGVQAETDQELEGIHANLQKADSAIVAEKGAQCCYAVSDKYWVTDPQGVPWESFRSLGTVPFYGEDSTQPTNRATDEPSTCCGAGASSRVESTSCCAKT
jgi:catechol 2,3-dioxygenase-like lactoylglutathione lyase family enzyme